MTLGSLGACPSQRPGTCRPSGCSVLRKVRLSLEPPSFLFLTIRSRPNNHVVLDPIPNSPLMKRLGLESNDFTRLNQHLTMEQWCKVRQSQQQRRTQAPKIEGKKYEYKEKELEIIPGLHAKVYN